MSDTTERVKKVTAELLKVDIAGITGETRFIEDLGAKSVQSVELVATFEDEFDIELDEEDALSVKTVGDAIQFIDKALAEN